MAVSDTISARHLHVMVLTETWHQQSTDLSLRRAAPPGYSIMDAARPSADVRRGGGVALIYSNRFAAKSITLDVKPTTFEFLGCTLRSASLITTYVVLYRPGSEPVCDTFFDDLTALLEIVVTFRSQIVITGDFNIHVNDPDDRHARRLSALLETFGLVQSVSQPTHRRGNTLDLLITRAEGRPTECTVDPPDVISDHALVVCRFPSQSFAAWNVEQTIRPWKKVDRSALRDALMSTALCSEVETSRGKSADELFDLYDDTLRRIADNLAPASTSTRRIRRLSPWFDNDCRSERRRTRLLERRYRKSRSDEDRTAWVKQMRSMHVLYERKENLYWTTCIANEAGNPRKMWNSVSAVLRRCKDPSVQPSCLTADILSKFFKDKIDAVRMETDKADPPTYSSYSGDEFLELYVYLMAHRLDASGRWRSPAFHMYLK